MQDVIEFNMLPPNMAAAVLMQTEGFKAFFTLVSFGFCLLRFGFMWTITASPKQPIIYIRNAAKAERWQICRKLGNWQLCAMPSNERILRSINKDVVSSQDLRL